MAALFNHYGDSYNLGNTTDMKKYYLKTRLTNPVETQDEPIIWIYRWNGKIAYSTAFNELILKFYFEN